MNRAAYHVAMRKPKILVVDDDPDLVKNLAAYG
jgi:hypothetical protein